MWNRFIDYRGTIFYINLIKFPKYSFSACIVTNLGKLGLDNVYLPISRRYIAF
jgi:hypothetical protein